MYCFFVFLLCGSSSFDSFRGVRAAYILYVCIHILRVFIDWNKCLWCYFSNRFCCCSPLLSSFSSSSSGCQPPFLRNFSYMAFLTLWPNMCICSVWCGTVRYVYECIRAVQSDCVWIWSSWYRSTYLFRKNNWERKQKTKQCSIQAHIRTHTHARTPIGNSARN